MALAPGRAPGGPRDGQGLNLEALDLPAMDAAPAPAPVSTRRDSVEATLALKVCRRIWRTSGRSRFR